MGILLDFYPTYWVYLIITACTAGLIISLWPGTDWSDEYQRPEQKWSWRSNKSKKSDKKGKKK